MGLSFMSNNILYLVSKYNSISFFVASKNIFVNLLFSTFFTSLIQSSTAAINITQQLYKDNYINLQISLIFVLGANIGTTITGLLASIKSNKEGKFLALFNLIFNLLTALFVLVFINKYIYFINLIKNIFNLSFQDTITFFHFIFNFTGFILFGLLIKEKNKEVNEC